MATAFRGSQTRGALSSIARQTSQFEIGAQTSGRRSRHWPDNEQKKQSLASRESEWLACVILRLFNLNLICKKNSSFMCEYVKKLSANLI